MKKLLEKKYVNTGFVIALLILISVNIIIYMNISFHFEDEDVITKSLTIIQTSEALYSNIIEAETNRRGYLITNNPEFTKQYYPAFNSIDSAFNVLKQLIYSPNEKLLLDTLQQLIYNRKDLLEESIELQEKGSKDMTLQIEYTRRGKQTQDKISRLINLIEEEEKSILNSRLKEAAESAEYTITSLVAGNVIAFALLITAIVLLNRNINRRREIEKELEESRNWLETTLESIGDGVIVTGKEGEILFMNRVSEQITEWTSDEAKGIQIGHVFNICNEESGDKVENPIQKVLSTGEIVGLANHTILITKNKKETPIDDSAAPIMNSEGNIIGAVMVFRDITRRRTAERALLDSKKFIQRIADSIPSVLYIYKLSGPKITYANHKITELLGYASEDVIKMGESFFEKYIHPDDLVRMNNLYKRFAAAKDNEILNYEYRIRNSKGEWRRFRSYDVVFSRKGSATEMLGTAHDVTERKMLEEELKKYSTQLEELVEKRTRELRLANEKLKEEITERGKAERSIIEAEEKFRSLVENALVGIYILQDEKFAYVNPKYEEIFGYSRGEMTGMNTWKRIPEEFRGLVTENIRKRLENEIDTIQYTFRAMRKDNSLIDVEVKGAKMIYNGKTAIIGTLQDITERLKAEEELKRQREYLRTVIDTDPNLVFAKDWDGRFSLVNKAVADIYGTTVEELAGKTDADFNPNTEEVEHFLRDDREVMKTGNTKFIHEEKVSDSRTGETRWYQTIKVPLTADDGSKQVLGVAADITARKLAEEITKKSLKEKELLLKEIHHRVKNNLQIIVSLLKLQSKFVFDSRDLDIFNKSRSRVETMALIHEKLYKSTNISEIDIGNYLKDLVSHLLSAYKVNYEEIEFIINSDKINLGIDTSIPCGLIVNELVNNILKHAFPAGFKGRIEINLKKLNEDIVLEVKDNGVGIPTSFDIDKSDSLGMQLVDTLIKQIEGTLDVDTTDGTTFTIRFKETKYRERI